MSSDRTFVLQDDGSFVKSYDLEQQRLIMTQDISDAHSFTLTEARNVVQELGWLASEQLVLKAVSGVLKTV